MSQTILLARLAVRDVRRHLAEAALLVLVIAAATTTLTLGLVLHGETASPYNTTREATAGPDIVADLAPSLSSAGTITASARPGDLARLGLAPGVVSRSGPYPMTFALLRAHGVTTSAMLEGRDPAPAKLDQPALTAGSWIRPGGIVVERSFADALHLRVGELLTLNGRPYHVAGIAVDAANPPYPHLCAGGWCDLVYRPAISTKQISLYQPGLIWLPRADAISLATPDVGLSYLLNLKLADSAHAPTFAAAHTTAADPIVTVRSWQTISADAAKLVQGPHTALLAGSALLIILAVASVAVLVGGRLAEQTRRVGLLKAAGAAPGTVAAVLLVEHLLLTLAAALAGLAAGWALAPLLASPGTGLLGTAGAPPFTAATAATVVGTGLAVAVLATLIPAGRAARTSTIDALADAARSPRRGALLVAASSKLPTTLLLGVRVASRRPRRAALSALSVTVTEAGIIAILIEHLRLTQSAGLANPQTQRMNQVLLVITVMLVVLATVNALVITWATVLDTRHASALARALGATPGQVSAALCAAQLLPAIPGSLLGVPLGLLLVKVVGKSGDAYKLAPVWQYATVIAGTWIVMTLLTAIPAHLGSRRPTAQILQAELG